MNNKTLFAYFGHHKCATTWVHSIIHSICNDINLKPAYVHNTNLLNNSLDGYIKENNVDFLSYVNADINQIKDIDNMLGFHVIRDPRDILISAYFSHLHSHPTEKWPDLVKHREELNRSSQEEGLFLELELRKQEFECLYNWDYSREDILEIKMENIISSPIEVMLEAFNHLNLVDDTLSLKDKFTYLIAVATNKINRKSKGLFPFRSSRNKIPVDALAGLIFERRFSKIAKGRKQGEEDVKSHYRKGVAGDWMNYFTDEHRRYFKENYNDLLIKLGYEETTDW